MHALQQQQHQLMAQIQLTQQALMLGQIIDSADHFKDIKKDRERHASETTLGIFPNMASTLTNFGYKHFSKNFIIIKFDIYTVLSI